MPVARARREAAESLVERGRLAFARGRPRDAARLLTRALERLGADGGEDDSRLRARVLISLALAEFELSGHARASLRLHEAERLIDAHALQALRAPLHNQRGIFLLRRGLLEDALHEFDTGLALSADEALVDRCNLLANRGTVHMARGELAPARSDLTACIRAAQDAVLAQHELRATHNLGYVEFLSGHLPTALRLMDAAFSADPSMSPGVALLDRASVLVEAGLLNQAEVTLREAAAIFAADRLGLDVAAAQLEQARCVLALGDAAAARRLAASARDRYRRRGNDRGRRAAELVALQADLAAARPPRRLVAAASALQADLAADGLRLAARQAAMIAVEAELLAGRPAAAAEILAAVGPSRRDDPITGRLHSHFVHARVSDAAGRRSTAVRRIRRAQDELADHQASFGSLDLRTASAVHGRRLAEFDLDLALAGGRPSAVFTSAERSRAVSDRLPPVHPPDDPIAADLLAELRQTLESLRAVEHDRAASAPLLARRRELEGRIVARSWTVAGAGPATRAAALDEVRAALAEQGRTMVTYVQSGDELWAVVVGEALALHDLGPIAPILESVRRVRADLDVLAQPRLAGGIGGAVRASLRRSLDALAAALVTPLGLGPVPVVLVSTGELGQVPWASLAPLRGVSIVVAPSATTWLRASGPVFDGRAGVVALAGPGLARAVDEVDAVASVWPGAVFAPSATRADLARAVGTARVLHVAAHGVHQPDSPLFSSVRMADGPVFAHELDQAAQAPEHVVLSACEVGLATVRPGDEALGLASVLLHLGTRSVIAGLGRVSDELAARTMTEYHARLSQGADSAAALASALADVDSDVVAPFVCFGAAWEAPLSEFAVSAAAGSAVAASRRGFGPLDAGRVP